LLYATFKVVDFRNRHVFHLFTEPGPEKWFFFLEVGIGILIPVVLLMVRRLRRDPRILFAGASMVVAGFVLNRLNTSITGFERYHGFAYFPSWMEICVTLFVVTLGVVAYRFAVKYLPVFEH
jgi:Ni/Fe-hydrogenase subunit HybB-like protein